MKKCDCVEGENFRVRSDGLAASFFGFEVLRYIPEDLERASDVIFLPEVDFTDLICQTVEKVEKKMRENDFEGIIKLSPTTALSLFFGGVITVDNLKNCTEDLGSIMTTLTFDDFFCLGEIRDDLDRGFCI